MDLKQKTALLDAQDGIKVGDVETPVARADQCDQLSKSERFSSVQVKTEVVDVSKDNEGGNSDSRREIEILKNEITQQNKEIRSLTRMVQDQIDQDDDSRKRIKKLEDALKQKDDELGVMRSRLAERIDRGDDGNKRKFDESAEPSKKKARSGKLKKLDKQKYGGWCFKCRNCHYGPCSSSTVKCRNCEKVGHSHATCKSDSICYNCKETGHISHDCMKEKRGPCCYSCGEVGHGSKECPKRKSG